MVQIWNFFRKNNIPIPAGSGVAKRDAEKKKKAQEEANNNLPDPVNSNPEETGSKIEFDRGLEYADKILGPEGLRTAEMRDVMEKRKKQAEEGISQEEQLAMKKRMEKIGKYLSLVCKASSEINQL